jgi:chromosome segregation ATPase
MPLEKKTLYENGFAVDVYDAFTVDEEVARLTSKLNQNAEHCEKKLQEKDTEIARLTSGRDIAMKQVHALEQQIGGFQPIHITDPSGMVASLHADLKKVVGERDHLKSTLEGADARIDDQAEEITNLMAERDQLKEEITGLTEDLEYQKEVAESNARKCRAALEHEDKASKENTKLKAERVQFKEEVARLTDEVKGLESAYIGCVDGANAEKKKLVAERDQLKQEVDQLAQKGARLRGQRDSLDDENVDLKASVKSLSNNLRMASDRVDGLLAERDHVYNRLSSAERALIKVQEEGDHLREQVAQYEGVLEFNREAEVLAKRLQRELDENHCCVTDRDAALIERDTYKRALDVIKDLIIEDCKHCEERADVPCWEVPGVEIACQYQDFITIIKEASEQ